MLYFKKANCQFIYDRHNVFLDMIIELRNHYGKLEIDITILSVLH